MLAISQTNFSSGPKSPQGHHSAPADPGVEIWCGAGAGVQSIDVASSRPGQLVGQPPFILQVGCVGHRGAVGLGVTL